MPHPRIVVTNHAVEQARARWGLTAWGDIEKAINEVAQNGDMKFKDDCVTFTLNHQEGRKRVVVVKIQSGIVVTVYQKIYGNHATKKRSERLKRKREADRALTQG